MAEESSQHEDANTVLHRGLQDGLVLPVNKTNIGTAENESDDIAVRMGILSLLVVLIVLLIIARVYFGRIAYADDRTLPDEDIDLSDNEEKSVEEEINQIAADDSHWQQTNTTTKIETVYEEEEGNL
jgi:hypothetical protein